MKLTEAESKQGKGIWKSKEEFSNPYNWSGYVVGQILSKPEYMGHTVNFRSHKQSYKDKNAVMNPMEDWLIFENTHEAIVDREAWELAQKLRKTPKRIAELDTIIKKLYESFAVGRITDERFDSLLADYEAEQKALQTSVAEAEEKLSAFAEDTARVEQFLELARKYTDFSELTTPMINEFIEKIIVHAPERIDGDRVQEVEIHLRFIGQFELPAPELTEEEVKRQEFLKKERIRSRERYQKLKSGECTVGVPVTLTCKCCGQEFASRRTNTLFCGNCGKVFPTTRSSVKYCSDDCRYAAQIKRQGARKKALREAKNEKETKTA